MMYRPIIDNSEPITLSRDKVLDAVALGVFIRALKEWLRQPCNRSNNPYCIEAPYGQVADFQHGFAGMSDIEREHIIELITGRRYIHERFACFSLEWDEACDSFRWARPRDFLDLYM